MRFRRHRWIVFLSLVAAYFFVYFQRVAPGPLYAASSIMGDLGIEAGAAGLLASTYFASYALIQIPAGILSDRLGPRKTVTIFLTLAVVASAAFALVTDYNSALLARVMIGFGCGVIFVPTIKALSEWYEVQEFATITGVLSTLGSAGALSATALLPIMLLRWGWRDAYLYTALAFALVIPVVWFIVRDRPQDVGYPAIHEYTSTSGVFKGMCDVVRMRHFWMVFWSLAIWYGVVMGLATWLPSFFRDLYGVNEVVSGGAAGLLWIGIMIGGPIAGILADRHLGRKPVYTRGAAGFAILLLALAFAPGGWTVAAVIVVVGGVIGSWFVVSMALVKETVPIGLVGTAIGILNTSPFIGGFIYPWAMGLCIEVFGHGIQGYRAAIGICVVGLLIALFLATQTHETLEVGV